VLLEHILLVLQSTVLLVHLDTTVTFQPQYVQSAVLDHFLLVNRQFAWHVMLVHSIQYQQAPFVRHVHLELIAMLDIRRATHAQHHAH
jgi:hypothetical protein